MGSRLYPHSLDDRQAEELRRVRVRGYRSLRLARAGNPSCLAAARTWFTTAAALLLDWRRMRHAGRLGPVALEGAGPSCACVWCRTAWPRAEDRPHA